MTPDSLATFLAFLALVAPGIVYKLVLDRRLPSGKESPFREASKVALSSLIFSSLGILVLALLSSVTTLQPVDFAAWVRNGDSYLASNLAVVVLSLSIVFSAACLLAAAAAHFYTRNLRANITNQGTWYTIFRTDRPPDTQPWVHVKLESEDEFWGYLRHYSIQDENEQREIVLGGTELFWKAKGKSAREAIGNNWDAICINADKLVYFKVIYMTESGTSVRRVAPRKPQGQGRAILNTMRLSQTAGQLVSNDDGVGPPAGIKQTKNGSLR